MRASHAEELRLSRAVSQIQSNRTLMLPRPRGDHARDATVDFAARAGRRGYHTQPTIGSRGTRAKGDVKVRPEAEERRVNQCL